MAKKEKSGDLGRALVKHHNQMVQQSKEKGRFYSKQHKRILESVTEIGDIEAVIEQAEEADLIYANDNPIPNLLRINLNTSSGGNDLSPEARREQQKREEALYASSLRVPRRPPWNAKLTVEELDFNERQAFLIWRRSLARLEENEKLVLTPFEKNLDIWRQLWRVLERSDLLVMVVDARDPLFYRCPDLEAYAREINEHKRTLLLINKADLLPSKVRQRWADYFTSHSILFLFWSAKAASAALKCKKLSGPRAQDSPSPNAATNIYGRDELLARLQAEAEAIAARASGMKIFSPCHSPSCSAESSSSRHVVVGFVGYPNVGKSSTINALVGEKRTGVTSTPGKTKHFQTLVISDQLILCDCPGLVFPSFSSSRYEMIAAGVLPIDRMTEHREAVQVVANQVPRHTIEAIYNISLPEPKPYEDQSRPPLASEILRAYCSSRGYVSSSGLPDETRAARQILKDYIDGKLPHFEMPPGQSDEGFDREDVDDLRDGSESGSSVDEDPFSPADETVGIAHGPQLSHMLSDLDSFDAVNMVPSNSRAAARKNKPSAASHKNRKKPQRKKDRSWRVDNDGSDGTPVVRVFQKPINAGPMKAG